MMHRIRWNPMFSPEARSIKPNCVRRFSVDGCCWCCWWWWVGSIEWVWKQLAVVDLDLRGIQVRIMKRLVIAVDANIHTPRSHNVWNTKMPLFNIVRALDGRTVFLNNLKAIANSIRALHVFKWKWCRNWSRRRRKTHKKSTTTTKNDGNFCRFYKYKPLRHISMMFFDDDETFISLWHWMARELLEWT